MKRTLWQRLTGQQPKALAGTITRLPTGHTPVIARGPVSSAIRTLPEPKELARLVPEMRKDYQVAFYEKILAANVGAIEVTVSGDGGPPELVEKFQALWDQSAAGMRDDIAYGRVAHEKVWDTDCAYSVPRKLEPLPFEESRMKLADDGRFDGIEIRLKDGTWQHIAAENCWWLALDPTAKQPHGKSRFQPAPEEVWKERRGAKENRKTAQSKWALRGPIVHGPETIADEMTGQPKDAFALFKPAIDEWGKGGLLYVPNAMKDPEKGVYEFAITEPNMQSFDPGAMNASMERLDVEMLRAFGFPEKTLIEGAGVGTYGAVAQQMLILFAVVEDILGQRVESFRRYVIGTSLEASNLPSDCITISFTKITNRPDAFVYEVIKLLLANPQFIEGILSGGVDVRQLLEQAGLPVTEQLEATLAAVAQRIAAAADVPAGGAAPAGEFGALGRRQWTNNTKAIRDVLADLIGGKTSEAMASELLQTLGLSPERAAALIADSQDGAVDDPELQEPAALADWLVSKKKLSNEAKVLEWSSGDHPRDGEGKFISTISLDLATEDLGAAVAVRGRIRPADLPDFDDKMGKIHGKSYQSKVKTSGQQVAPKAAPPAAKAKPAPQPESKSPPQKTNPPAQDRPTINLDRHDTSKMKKIGEGSARTVYEDGETVVKAAKNRQAKSDNKTEMAISQKHPLFAEVKEGAADGSWLRQEKLSPVAAGDIAAEYGVSAADAAKAYRVPIKDAFGLPSEINGDWMVASAWAANGGLRAAGLGSSADKFIDQLKSIKSAVPGIDLTDLGYAPQWGRSVGGKMKIADFSLATQKPAALAQVAIPQQGFKVPQASQVVNAGLREFDRLYSELVDAMVNGATAATLNGIRRQILSTEANMRIAGRVLGMLSPWQPRVNTYADSAAADETERLKVMADSPYRFPWIKSAVDFLESVGVTTSKDFAAMALADVNAVEREDAIDSGKRLRTVQKRLSEAIERGDDLRTFRKAIEGETALSRSQTETLYRTMTKRGYVEGFDRAMKSPVVAAEFPAVLFTATPDARVRDDHWDIDGVVVMRSDRAAYNALRKASQDYNCRCSLIPLSADEAEQRGVKTYSELPADVRAKYG